MRKNKLKIGFISKYSPEDKKASSGTNYKMAEALNEIGDLNWIKIEKSGFFYLLLIIQKIWNRINSIIPIRNSNLDIFTTKFGSKLGYKKIDKSFLDSCDIIVAFFCMPNLAWIKTKKPLVYITDATFPSMLDYYPSFSNLLRFNQKNGIQLEKMAMDNSDLVILSSNWAANSAITELNQDPNKIKIIEFGANIDQKDTLNTDREIKEKLELLFLGVDWERKGGQIAVDTVKWLNENGISTRLHIVGIKNLDKKIKSLSYINDYGFLNKNNPEEYNQITEILLKTNALLLPTKAECSAIAFAEASANGLPVFTHNTGGVSNYITDGINGYMLPLGSTGEDFGKKIKETIENSELSKMSELAREVYKTKLNWDVWKKRVINEIYQLWV